MAKYYSGISSGDTLDGMIANGGEYGINPSQDIDCENIECGIITATSGSFSGNVSVGGTLTYEDVKNIDSIGIITARSGIAVTGGQLIVGAAFSVGAAGVVTATSYYGDGSALSGIGNTDYVVSIATTTGDLNVSGVATIGTGVTVYGNAGIVSATKFYGDGSNLTNTGVTEVDIWTLAGDWPLPAGGTWSSARLGDAVNTAGTGTLIRDSDNNMPVGTGLTHANGLFTFPSAGTWEVTGQFYLERYSNNNTSGLEIALDCSMDGNTTVLMSAEQDINASVTHSNIHLTGIMNFTNTGNTNLWVRLNSSGNVYIKALGSSQNLIFKKLA